MEDRAVTTVNTNKPLNGLIRWIAVTSSIVVIGIAGYGVVLVSSYVAIVGIIWLCVASLLPLGGLTWLAVYLMRAITNGNVVHIGETGTIITDILGRKTIYHPLALKEYRTKDKIVNSTTVFECPTMLQLLKEGAINTIELLIGYKIDGTAFYGTWDTLRSTVIAGKSRSGKTVTLVFLLCQALLSGAKVYVNDPHYAKASGLLKVLTPLLPFIVVGRTLEEILANAHEYIAEMQQRLSPDYDGLMTPWIFITDEWTVLLRDLSKDDRDFLVKLVLDTNEAYAGVNGFCIIAGHEWTARESGGKYGASVRRAFHSTIVHRLDEDYAKFLLTGVNKKYSKQSPNLATGTYFLQDSEGNEVLTLVTPFYGRNKEAITLVAEMLNEQLQIAQPTQSYITETNVSQANSSVPMLPAQTQRDIHTEELEVTATSESETVKVIHRLRKRNVAHRDISYAVGLYGPKYNEYKALCEKHNISLTEVVEQ
jgi:hypothetical protein